MHIASGSPNLKLRLKRAQAKFDPEIIKTDNHCEFGKWLYDDFPKGAENTAVSDNICAIHASFHRTAAHILRLAMNGHKDEALRLMDGQGEFMGLSVELIQRLKELQIA